MKTVAYPVALRGLGNEFSEAEQPPDYARILTNRYINLKGEAEKRPGLKSFQSVTDSLPTFLGKIDCLTEHVSRSGTPILMASGINTAGDKRQLFRYAASASQWSEVSAPIATDVSGALTKKAYAVQHTDKSIFVAGDFRPRFYTEERGQTFRLSPVVEAGSSTSGTTKTLLFDTGVSSWSAGTFVRANDLVYNATKGGYGIVTSVGASNIDVSPITSAGDGGKGIGITSSPMAPGDAYEIWDLVENNIIQRNVNVTEFDNTGVAASGSNAGIIAVSGVDFASTNIRVGDYIYNTTQNAVTQVSAISANLVVASISGMTTGDSLIFLKSAVPIANYAHVHYGRLYLVDNREPNKIRVSGPDDPQDFTTFNLTLDSATLNYGAKQPQGEEILTLATFQRFLVAGGRKNVYIDQGINPIVDTSGASSDLEPVGLFTQGCVSRRSLANIGADMLFAAADGMRQFRLTDILAVESDNISEVIKTELRNAIKSNLDTEDAIQGIHYPRRNWVMLKVGSTIYNFNYTPVYIDGQLIRSGSWSKFTGRVAECNEFYVKSNGDLICSYYDTSAQRSFFYEFDTGAFQDDATDIVTDYETAWLTLTTGDGSGIVRDGRYIKPYFANSADQVYNITATSDLETQDDTDTAIVSAVGGGSGIGMAVVGSTPIGSVDKRTNELKYPLRWRGEQAKFRITASAGVGTDTLSKFIIYGNDFGRE